MTQVSFHLALLSQQSHYVQYASLGSPSRGCCTSSSSNQTHFTSHLTQPQRLILSHRSITLIDEIPARFCAIIEVDLSHNFLRSLLGIEQLFSLRSLNVSFNFLSDVEELHRITNRLLLKSLDISGNPITHSHAHLLTLDVLRRLLFPVLAFLPHTDNFSSSIDAYRRTPKVTATTSAATTPATTSNNIDTCNKHHNYILRRHQSTTQIQTTANRIEPSHHHLTPRSESALSFTEARNRQKNSHLSATTNLTNRFNHHNEEGFFNSSNRSISPSFKDTSVQQQQKQQYSTNQLQHLKQMKQRLYENHNLLSDRPSSSQFNSADRQSSPIYSYSNNNNNSKSLLQLQQQTIISQQQQINSLISQIFPSNTTQRTPSSRILSHKLTSSVLPAKPPSDTTLTSMKQELCAGTAVHPQPDSIPAGHHQSSSTPRTTAQQQKLSGKDRGGGPRSKVFADLIAPKTSMKSKHFFFPAGAAASALPHSHTSQALYHQQQNLTQQHNLSQQISDTSSLSQKYVSHTQSPHTQLLATNTSSSRCSVSPTSNPPLPSSAIRLPFSLTSSAVNRQTISGSQQQLQRHAPTHSAEKENISFRSLPLTARESSKKSCLNESSSSSNSNSRGGAGDSDQSFFFFKRNNNDPMCFKEALLQKKSQMNNTSRNISSAAIAATTTATSNTRDGGSRQTSHKPAAAAAYNNYFKGNGSLTDRQISSHSPSWDTPSTSTNSLLVSIAGAPFPQRREQCKSTSQQQQHQIVQQNFLNLSACSAETASTKLTSASCSRKSETVSEKVGDREGLRNPQMIKISQHSHEDEQEENNSLSKDNKLQEQQEVQQQLHSASLSQNPLCDVDTDRLLVKVLQQLPPPQPKQKNLERSASSLLSSSSCVSISSAALSQIEQSAKGIIGLSLSIPVKEQQLAKEMPKVFAAAAVDSFQNQQASQFGRRIHDFEATGTQQQHSQATNGVTASTRANEGVMLTYSHPDSQFTVSFQQLNTFCEDERQLTMATTAAAAAAAVADCNEMKKARQKEIREEVPLMRESLVSRQVVDKYIGVIDKDLNNLASTFFERVVVDKAFFGLKKTVIDRKDLERYQINRDKALMFYYRALKAKAYFSWTMFRDINKNSKLVLRKISMTGSLTTAAAYHKK